jgi:hypothetical protein
MINTVVWPTKTRDMHNHHFDSTHCLLLPGAPAAPLACW